MLVQLEHKPGDTFRKRFVRDGGLEGITVAATIQFKALSVTLQSAVIDAEAGVFDLLYLGDTSTWPQERARCDIKYTRAGQIARTPTFYVLIGEAITP